MWCVAWLPRDPKTRAVGERVWCAAKGSTKPDPAASSVETRCEHFVILPCGVEQRAPTCPDCVKKVRR